MTAFKTHLPIISAFALLALTPGCGNDSDISQSALAAAQARWNSKGSANYTVESRIYCFCARHLGTWTRLTVRDGVVVSTEPLEPLPEGVTPSTAGWQTVSEALDFLVEKPGDLQHPYRVVFDPHFGYPLEYATECSPEIADCSTSAAMRNLRLD
jgi:hypothetical protein